MQKSLTLEPAVLHLLELVLIDEFCLSHVYRRMCAHAHWRLLVQSAPIVYVYIKSLSILVNTSIRMCLSKTMYTYIYIYILVRFAPVVYVYIYLYT